MVGGGPIARGLWQSTMEISWACEAKTLLHRSDPQRKTKKEMEKDEVWGICL